MSHLRRFTNRLADRFEWLDIDAMLDTLPPGAFENWWAAAIIEGWDTGWRQAGTIAAEAHNAGLFASPRKISKADFKWPDSNEPFESAGGRNVMTATESEARAAARYGSAAKPRL